MALFTLSADTNIDALTSKTGGDRYDTNGFNLIIDQDSRVGLNQTPTSSLGTLTVNATKGGKIIIDARKVKMIPFINGSGNIPAWNTHISRIDASGLLIGVYTQLYDVSSRETGTAMPTSGFLKIKQWNDVSYGAGTLTGISADASTIQFNGWLHLAGDDVSAAICNRLGEFNVYGDWYLCGSTSGTSNQILRAPNDGLLNYLGGVFIEKTPNSNDYEFWGNAGTTTTTGTDASRGKVVWIDASASIRIGNSGAATNGYTPIANLKVVVPNVFLSCASLGNRSINKIPHATLGSRYTFTTTGGGVINMDKVSSAWYLGCSQPYSVQLTNSSFVDAISIAECATPMNWTKVGVGNKATTALLTSPLTLSLCFAGGTFTECVWNRVSQAAANAHINTYTDIANFTFNDDTLRSNTIRANATTYSIIGTRVSNCTFNNQIVIGSQMLFAQSADLTFNNTKFMSAVSGTTVATYVGYVWDLTSSCSNFAISGLDFPVIDTHPYTAIIGLAGAGSTVAGINNIKVRNIGTPSVPLRLGTTVAGCGLIAALGAAGAVSDIKIQHVYCVSTRTGILTGDNSATRVTLENVWGDYADAADPGYLLNFERKGVRGIPLITAQTGVYGTHWYDAFTGLTTGRIGLSMNETTSLTSSQVTLSNGAAFTSTGGLYMPALGQIAEFSMPYYVLGHNRFQNLDVSIAGSVRALYNIEYQMDKYGGTPYPGSWTTMSAANLRAETGWEPSTGFKMKWRLTCISTNTTPITSIFLQTDVSIADLIYQYPLDTYTLSLTNIQPGSDVIIYAAGTTTIRQSSDAISGNTNTYTYANAESIDIGVFFAGYIPLYIRNYSLTTSNASLPISQVVDRAYLV